MSIHIISKCQLFLENKHKEKHIQQGLVATRVNACINYEHIFFLIMLMSSGNAFGSQTSVSENP